VPNKKRVLCVDDSEDICKVVELSFRASDIEAISTMSATEALKLLDREKFDLYILDLVMPAALDQALCEAIRERDQSTPIVIFSGKSDEASRLSALSAGANAYVVKPGFEELTKLVRQILYGQGGISSVLLGD
jgi:DNA-binding response OmpR family regulator